MPAKKRAERARFELNFHLKIPFWLRGSQTNELARSVQIKIDSSRYGKASAPGLINSCSNPSALARSRRLFVTSFFLAISCCRMRSFAPHGQNPSRSLAHTCALGERIIVYIFEYQSSQMTAQYYN
jgi:hypothetical protein